jgi:Na+:H+ antiporter, NhaA family
MVGPPAHPAIAGGAHHVNTFTPECQPARHLSARGLGAALPFRSYGRPPTRSLPAYRGSKRRFAAGHGVLGAHLGQFAVGGELSAPVAYAAGRSHRRLRVRTFARLGRKRRLDGHLFLPGRRGDRREVYCGELSEWRRAALPAAAALGGMLAPAGIYLALAGAPETRAGWGVPMATDIAFAVGILTLLGNRAPPALRVLLLALAVIDDLGAIIVIAVFYSAGLDSTGLLVAAGGLLGVLLMQRLGIRSKLAYVAPAVVAWGGVYSAGIHPTIAGVAVGLMTPVRAWLGPEGFVDGVRREMKHLEGYQPSSLSPQELAGTLKQVDAARREAMSPAESLIQSLHPWIAFGIMPIFALANSGVSLQGAAFDSVSWRVAGSVAIGLVIGKPLGVLLASVASVRLGLSRMPAGVTALHLVVLGLVAGVGFTMALFIAQLAFPEDRLLAAAKVGILVASAVAGIVALLVGRAFLPSRASSEAARSADEAEASSEL